MESGDYLRFKEEIRPYLKMLRQASETIMDQGVSLFPIFVMHTDEIELGIPLLQNKEPQLKWAVNASTLEEFVSKRLIQPEKVEIFKSTYKDPLTHLCIFVVSGGSGEFIFLPKELSGAN